MPARARISPRLLPLAASFSLVFGVAVHTQTACAATLLVTDCTDGAGSGTLRNTIAAASSTDTVMIQAGTCSKITLDSDSEINSQQPHLTIVGPGSGQLTIDGGRDTGHYHRIFNHSGPAVDLLSITGVTLTHGKYKGNDPAGGCVFASGNVTLTDVVVTDCDLNPSSSAGTDSQGAGLWVAGYATLLNSTISANQTITVGTGHVAKGVGIYAAGGLNAVNSTISGNLALVPESRGGGAYVKSFNLYLLNTTIEHNYAGRGGGLYQKAGGATIIESTIANNSAHANGGFELHDSAFTHTLLVRNSTISGNVASTFQGGGATYMPAGVYNSTIAFNRSAPDAFPAGLYGVSTIAMESSIFAANTGGSGDIGTASKTGLSGSGNLIVATSDLVPLETLSSCPRLGPLANNGGDTLTHQLLFGSAAIDQGNLLGGFVPQDQRGAMRDVGGGVDIGAYERQADETQHTDDSVFLSGFEGPCD